MSCIGNLIRLMAAGAVATRAMTDTMNHVDKVGLTDVDIAGILGSRFNGGKIAPKNSSAWKKGMAVHYALGALIFPLALKSIFRHILPGSKTAKSLEYAVGLWAGGQFVVMPLLRKYHIFERQPDTKLTYLVGHLIYGSTLASGLNREAA